MNFDLIWFIWLSRELFIKVKLREPVLIGWKHCIIFPCSNLGIMRGLRMLIFKTLLLIVITPFKTPPPPHHFPPAGLVPNYDVSRPVYTRHEPFFCVISLPVHFLSFYFFKDISGSEIIISNQTFCFYLEKEISIKT